MLALKHWLNGLFYKEFLAKYFKGRSPTINRGKHNKLKLFEQTEMTKIVDSSGKIIFEDRRKGGERRVLADRRVNPERRHDGRDGTKPKRKSLRSWFRSKTNARLGVDRRKGQRRSGLDRRKKNLYSLLTQDEIKDLLSG